MNPTPRSDHHRAPDALPRDVVRGGAVRSNEQAEHTFDAGQLWSVPTDRWGKERRVPSGAQRRKAADVFSSYRPRDEHASQMWDDAHDVVLEALACIDLDDANAARTAAGLTVRYALYLENVGAWSRSTGDPIPFAHRYVVAYADHRHRTLRRNGADTSLAKLSQIGRAYQPHLWPGQVPTLRDRTTKTRYTVEEQAFFRTAATDYLGVYGDARIAATVAAGFGAGLSPHDFRLVRGHHVQRRDDGRLWVTVRADSPPQARRIPTQPEWAYLLEHAAALMADALLISGTTDDNRNFTQRVTYPLRKFTGHGLDFDRMRVTWLVGRMAEGVPERIIRHYAGLKDSARFRFVDDHWPMWDEATTARWLTNGGTPR